MNLQSEICILQFHPTIYSVAVAVHIVDHPLVLDAFADRVQEIIGGENKMNCALCKYRAQVCEFLQPQCVKISTRRLICAELFSVMS